MFLQRLHQRTKGVECSGLLVRRDQLDSLSQLGLMSNPLLRFQS